MATQRITLAKVAGAAAVVVRERFDRWRASGRSGELPPTVRAEVDRFAEALRANAAAPPVVYFSEWVDWWSMGDVVPGLGADDAPVACGSRFEACCHRPPVTLKAPLAGDGPAQESEWLAARLREAESAWDGPIDGAVLVVLREVLGGTVTDEELAASLRSVPPWLTPWAEGD